MGSAKYEVAGRKAEGVTESSVVSGQWSVVSQIAHTLALTILHIAWRRSMPAICRHTSRGRPHPGDLTLTPDPSADPRHPNPNPNPNPNPDPSADPRHLREDAHRRAAAHLLALRPALPTAQRVLRGARQPNPNPNPNPNRDAN